MPIGWRRIEAVQAAALSQIQAAFTARGVEEVDDIIAVTPDLS